MWLLRLWLVGFCGFFLGYCVYITAFYLLCCLWFTCGGFGGMLLTFAVSVACGCVGYGVVPGGCCLLC